MNKEEATQHALGYAAGREDGTGVQTVSRTDKPGWFEFGHAYGAGQEAYNTGQCGMFMPVRDAYARWQESRGLTIWQPDAGPEYTRAVRAYGLAVAHEHYAGGAVGLMHRSWCAGPAAHVQVPAHVSEV